MSRTAQRAAGVYSIRHRNRTSRPSMRMPLRVSSDRLGLLGGQSSEDQHRHIVVLVCAVLQRTNSACASS